MYCTVCSFFLYQVHEFFADFLALAPHLFSIGLPNIYDSLGASPVFFKLFSNNLLCYFFNILSLTFFNNIIHTV